MSLRLVEELGLSEYERDVIRIVAPVHDLGKLGIPDAILSKPGRLTEEEQRIMQNHSIYGEEIMSRFEVLSDEAKVIRGHHERYDGNGYPDRVSRMEIPFCSRIIAVADAYDAMVTDRPYRRAFKKEEAFEEIKRCKNTQFDPDIADAFIIMMEKADG
jgi:HD-GYP domain-containing protein (c-di-GMP phosphodiesterase class II)